MKHIFSNIEEVVFFIAMLCEGKDLVLCLTLAERPGRNYCLVLVLEPDQSHLDLLKLVHM